MGRVETLIRQWFELESTPASRDDAPQWLFKESEVQAWTDGLNFAESSHLKSPFRFHDLAPIFFSAFRIRVGPEQNELLELLWKGVSYIPPRSTAVEWTLSAPTFVRTGQVSVIESNLQPTGDFRTALERTYGIQVHGTQTVMLAFSVSPNEQWWVLDSRPDVFRREIVSKVARALILAPPQVSP